MRHILIAFLTVCLVAGPVLGAVVPRPAPDLTFSLPDGKQISLASYKGKVVALEFLLTTCPHCQRTSATMQKLYGELGPKGFQPLGVAINTTDKQLVNDYIKGVRATYPLGIGDRNMAVSFLQHSAIVTMWMPQLVIIDKKGTIRAQYDGTGDFFRNEEANLRSLLTSLLAE